MRYIAGDQSLTVHLFMQDVRNSEFGHWLSEVNALEINKFNKTLDLVNTNDAKCWFWRVAVIYIWLFK